MEGVCTTRGEYPGITPISAGILKTRKFMTLGPQLAEYNMTTHNNSLSNLIRGVGERVLFTNAKLERPIVPVRGAFDRLASYSRVIVRELGRPSPVSRHEFVDYYSGPRRLVYERAVKSLELKPVRPADAYLSTFVKAEKHNFRLKADPAPRVIQPRSPRYNVEVGRYLRVIEHDLYSAIDNLFGSPTIFSPYNAYTQAKHLRTKWDSFQDPVCIGLDASRFDQHVSLPALQFEHDLYNRVFRSPELKRLLSWQLENTGFAKAGDGEFRYKVLGSRMSGDMNTSMGNKLIMCLVAKSYLDTKGFRTEFVNNGDDCLVLTERKQVAQLTDLKDYMADFGFKIVTEVPVYSFEEIEFCQTKPVCCNGVWRMVRNVRTCLYKDVTCITLGHDEESYRRWLHDIGVCGLAVASDVPVLGAFYRALVRLGQPGDYAGSWDKEYKWYHSMSRNARCPQQQVDDYGRYSFWVSSGLTPDEQISLEDLFSRWSWEPDERQVITEHISLILQI